MTFPKINNNHGNSFFILLLTFIILAAAAYIVYTNKDFQRAHRKEIRKVNFYLRDYKKKYKDLRTNLSEKMQAWEKSHPTKVKKISPETKPETRTFDELIYDEQRLQKEIPPEMIRHQPDEITICAFNADFLINNSLSDKEIVHLANILRLCDLSSIAGLTNQHFLPKITTLLKILRYDASFEINDPASVGKTIIGYLYRNDKIQSLKRGKIYSAENSFSTLPYYKPFKVGDFDFIVATFNTPAYGFALTSIEPLENFYETIKNENLDIKDIMIFGDFTFRSDALSWDSASLLPTFARAASSDKNETDLLGNFWFKKNDLVEFNGKSGILNIDENQFPSKQKSSLSTNKPIWTQFKIMSDDD